MSECMQFPDTWEEFEQSYGFEDKKEIYTNGSRLIQSFRVKQWLDHTAEPERTAKVIEHEMIVTDADGCSFHRTKYICGNCKEKVNGGDEYCSHCGSKLIWVEEE